MKKGLVLLMVASLSITSCKKDKVETPTTPAPQLIAGDNSFYIKGDSLSGKLLYDNVLVNCKSGFLESVYIGGRDITEITMFDAGAEIGTEKGVVNLTINFPGDDAKVSPAKDAEISLVMKSKTYESNSTSKGTIRVSNYGPVGGYVTGLFEDCSLTTKDASTGKVTTVILSSGRFKVKRESDM